MMEEVSNSQSDQRFQPHLKKNVYRSLSSTSDYSSLYDGGHSTFLKTIDSKCISSYHLNSVPVSLRSIPNSLVNAYSELSTTSFVGSASEFQKLQSKNDKQHRTNEPISSIDQVMN